MKESWGTKVAARNRAKCNKLTRKERNALMRRAMKMLTKQTSSNV